MSDKPPKVTRRKITDYTPAAINPNKGTPRGVPAIVESLNYAGAGRSILVDRDGEAIAGSHTIQAAIDAGITDVIEVHTTGHELVAVVRDDLDLTTDAKARALQIADNRATILGYGQDDELVAALLNQIGAEDAKLVQAAGFDELDLKTLLESLTFEQVMGGSDRDRGETPDERLDTYLSATIKQIVLLFDNDQYTDVIERLAAIRRDQHLETNTEVFLKLLEEYENARSQPPNAGLSGV